MNGKMERFNESSMNKSFQTKERKKERKGINNPQLMKNLAK